MASQWTIRQAVNTEIELFHSCIQTKRMYIARNDPDDPNLAITRNGHTIVECGQIMFIKLANFLFNLCNWYFFAVDVCHHQIIGRPGEVEPQIGSFQSLFFAKFFSEKQVQKFPSNFENKAGYQITRMLSEHCSRIYWVDRRKKCSFDPSLLGPNRSK